MATQLISNTKINSTKIIDFTVLYAYNCETVEHN